MIIKTKEQIFKQLLGNKLHKFMSSGFSNSSGKFYIKSLYFDNISFSVIKEQMYFTFAKSYKEYNIKIRIFSSNAVNVVIDNWHKGYGLFGYDKPSIQYFIELFKKNGFKNTYKKICNALDNTITIDEFKKILAEAYKQIFELDKYFLTRD